MRIHHFRVGLLASSVLVSGLLAAAPLQAQVAPAEASPEVKAAAAPSEDKNAIVVTGSLIKNPNLTAASPVSVVGTQEIELRQANTAEEILRTIPGTVPGIGSNVNNGNGGAATLNLRGLGSNRNIVLLNGARLAPYGLAGVVDTNNIPLALIERVDVLTGGASTTYGADAVSGVVNFITKKDFAGFRVDVSDQISQRGDAKRVRTDVTFGANFDDGRGNATLSLGYQKQDPLYVGDRDFGYTALNPKTGTPAGAGSATAFPSTFTVGALGTRQIDPSGSLVPVFSTYNQNPTNVYQTPFLRYNIYGSARYKLNDAIEVYGEGLFSRQTVTQIIAPTGVFNGQTLTLSVGNPFIPATARAQFCANNDFNPNLAGIQTITPAECNAAALTNDPSNPAYRSFVTAGARRFVEAGTRNTAFTTTYYQERVGLRGPLTSTLNFDVFGTYGQSDLVSRQTGQALLSRLLQEVDATSATTCRVGGICFPINLFGQVGSIDPRTLAYLNVATVVETKTSLATARGVINGDFGVASPFASHPIGIAVGAEYRRYTAQVLPDLPSQTPGEILGGGGATLPTNGAYDVKEVFAEVIAPVVEDKPFMKSLTVEAGVRRSDYSTAGSSTTWKAGGTWEPVSSLKFRGAYQLATRAPNINELFNPVTTGNSNLPTDPCAGTLAQNPNLSNANFRAVCIAQGAPAALIGTIPGPSAGQVNFTQGGNINLKVETANTLTVGAVFQPSFIPGFSASADYYHIKVSNAITAPTPGDIINACFGNITAASATDPACTSIHRFALNGGLNGSAAENPGLIGLLSNQGLLLTDGIDLTLNYKRNIGFGVLNLGFDGNWTHQSRFKANASSATSLFRDCVGHYSVNCTSIQPKFSWTQRTTLSVSKFDFSLLWRYISKETLESDGPVVNGQPTQLTGTAVGFYAPYSKIPAYNYFDFSIRANLDRHLTLTFTVDNLTNRKPPIVGTNIGAVSFNTGNTYPSTYDVVGRRFLMDASIRF